MDEPNDTSSAGERPYMTRRKWLKRALWLGAAAAAGVPYSYGPRITRSTLYFPNLPKGWDGVRIIQISDLHHGPLVPAAYLAQAFERARALPHDIAFITGDFVSISAHYIDSLLPHLRAWRAPLGVWATRGNHDYYTDPERIAASLEGIGIPVLNNESRRLARGGDAIDLVGVDDPSSDHQDLGAALRDTAPGSFRILLAHTPDIAWQLDEGMVDLTLSGHTHGGQFCLPGGRAILVPTNLGPDYAKGIFLWRGSTLYVNRGLGVVTLPIRLFCPPEIAHITLRRGTAPAEIT